MKSTNRRSSNSVGSLPAGTAWFRENFAFLMMRFRGRTSHLDHVIADIQHYDELVRSHTGRQLKDCRVLEIGYGARPNRLIALHSIGVDALGIDFDRPMLRFSFSAIRAILHRNGLSRALKTAVRTALFDRGERRALQNSLDRLHLPIKILEERFLVGNAAEFKDFGKAFDFVYSEDVFEHIAVEDIHKICANMRQFLTPGGLAAITPHIFTGIAGGHLVEWYPHSIDEKPKRTEPWEHLRKRRERADCHLNELIFDEYKNIFEQYFEIIDITHNNYGLGEHLLSDAVMADIAPHLNRRDLLTNNVTFLLRNIDH